MRKLAEAMPGFISYKVYTSEDGERCSIIEFESHEQLLAWRHLPEHRKAQQARDASGTTRSTASTSPIRFVSPTSSGDRQHDGVADR
jgi:heme-degrading monooxygenase HmoA